MENGFDGDYLDLNGDRVPLYNGMHDGGQGTNATYRGENNEGKHAEADDASEGGDFFQNAGDEKEQIRRLEDMNEKRWYSFQANQ